ncbi:unnamed protein product [Brugia pahangi]|uniref:Uncharacterized protein n=1 Tax=Brugia pahangi TaxID=6280 RepID=A0A0N4TSJ3_BRUPA|nr:unnamed protein product [Brugia pahangi]
MSSRMQHVVINDNPETLAISQFYANYCTKVTITMTTTTTTNAATSSVISSKMITQFGNKQPESCIYSGNRKIFAKTWNSAIHRLSLPIVAHHHPEFHFIIPIVNYKRFTAKDGSFPDHIKKMTDRKRSLQNNEHSKRVTVIDRPGQDKVHFTGARTRHRIVDVLKGFVSFTFFFN